MSSAIKFAQQSFASTSAGPMVVVGADALIPPTDQTRELVILVVGETARADHFSLNGYERDTNPRLRQMNVFSFSNFQACGTSTAVSVPTSPTPYTATSSGEFRSPQNLGAQASTSPDSES
jgi:lipid A ethanolaminephosphotransferase